MCSLSLTPIPPHPPLPSLCLMQWFYGRQGWCPGQHVQPLLWDVTADLGLKSNNITYNAQLYGEPYGGMENAAEIIMHAYLVFYASS